MSPNPRVINLHITSYIQYPEPLSPKPNNTTRLAHELRIPAELAAQAAELFGRYSDGEGWGGAGCAGCRWGEGQHPPQNPTKAQLRRYPPNWMLPKIVGFSPPKSSILIGFSIIFTIHFGVPLFLETPKYTKTAPFELIEGFLRCNLLKVTSTFSVWDLSFAVCYVIFLLNKCSCLYLPAKVFMWKWANIKML